jgi:hypothetical protein
MRPGLIYRAADEEQGHFSVGCLGSAICVFRMKLGGVVRVRPCTLEKNYTRMTDLENRA